MSVGREQEAGGAPRCVRILSIWAGHAERNHLNSSDAGYADVDYTLRWSPHMVFPKE